MKDRNSNFLFRPPIQEYRTSAIIEEYRTPILKGIVSYLQDRNIGVLPNTGIQDSYPDTRIKDFYPNTRIQDFYPITRIKDSYLNTSIQDSYLKTGIQDS